MREAPALTRHVPLTHRDRFLRAGEAYFGPGDWVIFQAVPVPAPGREPSPFYAMYVARLERNPEGEIVGLGAPICISPPGSANTCGWFHPVRTGEVLFASTLVPPATDQRSTFQVQGRRYVWLFPQEMDVVSLTVPAIVADRHGEARVDVPLPAPVPVFSRPDYDAECSWSADGRYVLYAHVREQEKTAGRPDADIWVYDTLRGEHRVLVAAPGYDGGPFFSPDGTRIAYRSDRRLDDKLQIFVADLAFDGQGDIVGVEREYQLTDNDHVNWAPYWHPSGEFLVYTTSEVSPTHEHHNYEVFAIEASRPALSRAGEGIGAIVRRARLTHHPHADLLPTVSPDGGWLMWTAQRGQAGPGEVKSSSQLWVARFDASALEWQPPPVSSR